MGFSDEKKEGYNNLKRFKSFGSDGFEMSTKYVYVLSVHVLYIYTDD